MSTSRSKTTTGAPAIAARHASYIFQSSIALWIVEDAHRRGHPLPYDYDSLVFIFAFVFGPLYFFSTRGLRGFISIGWSFFLVVRGWLSLGFLGASRFLLVRYSTT